MLLSFARPHSRQERPLVRVRVRVRAVMRLDVSWPRAGAGERFEQPSGANTPCTITVPLADRLRGLKTIISNARFCEVLVSTGAPC